MGRERPQAGFFFSNLLGLLKEFSRLRPIFLKLPRRSRFRKIGQGRSLGLIVVFFPAFSPPVQGITIPGYRAGKWPGS